MRSTRVLHIVGCHADGEVGDVIVAGVPTPPGATICEQSRFIARDQTLRNFVLNKQIDVRNLPTCQSARSPIDPKADIGWIMMGPDDTPPMFGLNSICLSTVLLDTGIIPMTEPVTTFVLEAPAGLVQVTAACRTARPRRLQVRIFPRLPTSLMSRWISPGAAIVSSSSMRRRLALRSSRRRQGTLPRRQ